MVKKEIGRGGGVHRKGGQGGDPGLGPGVRTFYSVPFGGLQTL